MLCGLILLVMSIASGRCTRVVNQNVMHAGIILLRWKSRRNRGACRYKRNRRYDVFTLQPQERFDTNAFSRVNTRRLMASFYLCVQRDLISVPSASMHSMLDKNKLVKIAFCGWTLEPGLLLLSWYWDVGEGRGVTLSQVDTTTTTSTKVRPRPPIRFILNVGE